MSELRAQIKAKSASLVRRETVLLPECGMEVQVRGLMAGEVRRCGEHKRSSDVQVALSVEDPATSKPVWNANSLDDLNEIAALHSVDLATIVDTSNRLSGLGKLQAMYSEMTKSSSTPSPEPSAELSQS
jgi:hypothetical protein